MNKSDRKNVYEGRKKEMLDTLDNVIEAFAKWVQESLLGTPLRVVLLVLTVTSGLWRTLVFPRETFLLMLISPYIVPAREYSMLALVLVVIPFLLMVLAPMMRGGKSGQVRVQRIATVFWVAFVVFLVFFVPAPIGE